MIFLCHILKTGREYELYRLAERSPEQVGEKTETQPICPLHIIHPEDERLMPRRAAELGRELINDRFWHKN